MSTIAEIEAAIEKLPPVKFRELRQWIAERDSREWDEQIERDVAAGKVDELRKKVRADAPLGQLKRGLKIAEKIAALEKELAGLLGTDSATTAEGAEKPHEAAMPDFLARQKARFGNRILRDSQAVLDGIRADRF